MTLSVQVKRRFRLTSSTDFKRVRRSGKSYAHPLIVLVKFPNDLGESRFGFSASKSIGNAVNRNRAKRRMRAVIMQYMGIIAPGYDVILIARQPLNLAGFNELQNAVELLLRKSGLITTNGEDS